MEPPGNRWSPGRTRAASEPGTQVSPGDQRENDDRVASTGALPGDPIERFDSLAASAHSSVGDTAIGLGRPAPAAQITVPAIGLDGAGDERIVVRSQGLGPWGAGPDREPEGTAQRVSSRILHPGGTSSEPGPRPPRPGEVPDLGTHDTLQQRERPQIAPRADPTHYATGGRGDQPLQLARRASVPGVAGAVAAVLWPSTESPDALRAAALASLGPRGPNGVPRHFPGPRPPPSSQPRARGSHVPPQLRPAGAGRLAPMPSVDEIEVPSTVCEGPPYQPQTLPQKPCETLSWSPGEPSFGLSASAGVKTVGIKAQRPPPQPPLHTTICSVGVSLCLRLG